MSSDQHIFTFPAPEQFRHLSVVGACRSRLEALVRFIGSVVKHTPLAEHLAHGKYPKRTHIILSCLKKTKKFKKLDYNNP